MQTYNSSNCAGHDPTKTLTTTYQDYDVYGHAVATVDGAAAATPPLYNTQGCSVASGTIVASSTAWTKSTYTSCTAYNSTPLTLCPADLDHQRLHPDHHLWLRYARKGMR